MKPERKVFCIAVTIAADLADQADTIDGLLDKVLRLSPADQPEGSTERWALEFLRCLPPAIDDARLLTMVMLERHVCGNCGSLIADGWCGYCEHGRAGYELDSWTKKRAGGLASAFWRDVQNARLFNQGARLL